ncbi:MAG TPA: SIS domain-containing protein [Sedimentisphaerales bacterium]|nr:SIS domain-containing protein [Sedimentisphaerales bacterium]
MAGQSATKWVEKAREVISRESDAVRALTAQIDESAVDVAKLMSNCKGHILVAGAGTSRAISQRFAHLLSCCGTPAIALNASDCLHGGAGVVTSGDVLYVISKGGHSREINCLVEIAKGKGAKIVAHTENPDSPLARMSDVIYRIKAPDDVDPYGMIATGSSLVNGAACDVLCVLLLEMRGYSKEQFSVTHPEGAVGKKIAEGK